MRFQKTKFHFVGIGGIGMCGLAELLHNIGAEVTGSDLSENSNTERLKAMGIQIFKGHKVENVGDVDVVVYTSAASMDNPELQSARSRQIPLIARAEALAEIMRLKRGIAVAGTHGKTTTTSMASAIFLEGKLQPTIFVGGRLEMIQSTALLGTGEWMLAEADESDGSFSRLSPEIAIITNIDSDHLDFYKSFDNLQAAFLAFAQKIPFYGALIACGDDPVVRKLFANFPKRALLYGFEDHNDYILKGERGVYALTREGIKIGDFRIPVPGRHNALNATAAIIAGLVAGLSFEACAAGLLKYSGVDRRFQLKGEAKGISIYDDYGHHPTEVRATLQAFREKFPDRRLVVLFQPHRYSRTQICWHDFTTCFAHCDELLITDIYAAGEKPIEGISASRLVKEVKHDRAQFISKSDPISLQIHPLLKSGDVFLTLGAGDGWKVGMELLEKLS